MPCTSKADQPKELNQKVEKLTKNAKDFAESEGNVGRKHIYAVPYSMEWTRITSNESHDFIWWKWISKNTIRTGMPLECCILFFLFFFCLYWNFRLSRAVVHLMRHLQYNKQNHCYFSRHLMLAQASKMKEPLARAIFTRYKQNTRWSAHSVSMKEQPACPCSMPQVFYSFLGKL